jgi:CRISPR-associated protein Csx3
MNIGHYALRACPDGEGDFANEADPGTVREIRQKGAFTDTFMQRVAGYLQQRHLPLLVDVGGRPTAEQQSVFRHCTHAVLLVAGRPSEPDLVSREMQQWEEIMAGQGVPVIARLQSQLSGENQLTATEPTITGTLAELERGQQADGPAFWALVTRLAALFDYTEAELTAVHLAQAPVELSLDLPALARTLQIPDGRWQLAHLPLVQDYVPAGKPLALYGRAPVWLYAMLSAVSYPAPLWLYDARLGWIKTPSMPKDNGRMVQEGWETAVQEREAYTLVELKTGSQYLDIEQVDSLPLPAIPTHQGAILSGRLPNWIVTAIIRQWSAYLPWVAVYQPQLDGAVVVFSQEATVSVGQKIAL